MATIGKMISDLELRLYGGKPSDDNSIPRKQMRFWLDSANANQLSNWIKRHGGNIPSSVARIYDCNVIRTEAPECVGNCETRYYFYLPTNPAGGYRAPLTLDDDKGIMSVKMGKKKIYRLSSIEEVDLVLNLPFANNSPYFYRVGSKKYLFNGVFPDFCKISLVAVFVDTDGLSNDDPYPTIEELIPGILQDAEEIGRRELGTKQDLQDDGIG